MNIKLLTIYITHHILASTVAIYMYNLALVALL